MKKNIILGIAISLLLSACSDTEAKKLSPEERGYKDGISAMKNDTKMKKIFDDIQKKYNQTSDSSERYILIQGHLKGSIKGTCGKLTWSDDKHKTKSHEYLRAFESGCQSVYWNK